MIKRHLLTGLVLAGGCASRMRGGDESLIDKGLLELDGLPLIAIAQRYLQSRVVRILISANRQLDVYASYGTVISDDPVLGASAGPLAGVASALAETTTPWLMVIPVDVPRLPADLVERLGQAVVETDGKIAYACADQAHPLCMLLHRDVLESLQSFLQAGGRKVRQWQQLHRAEPVFFSESDDAFFNINTPDDLYAARRRALSNRTS